MLSQLCSLLRQTLARVFASPHAQLSAVRASIVSPVLYRRTLLVSHGKLFKQQGDTGVTFVTLTAAI